MATVKEEVIYPDATSAADSSGAGEAAAANSTKTFLSLLALHAMLDFNSGVFPVFKHLTGLSLGLAGLMASVAIIASWALQPILGMWADRGHRRFCVVWGTALTFPMMFLGLVGIHLAELGATAYWLIFAILVSARMGQALFHPAGATVAGESGAGRRSFLVAVFVALGWIGYGSSQGVFSFTYAYAGGHTEWLLIPGAAILIGGLIWCRPVEYAGKERPGMREAFAVLTSSRTGVVSLFLCLAAMSGLGQALFFLLPEFCIARGYPNWVAHGGALVFIVIGSAGAMVPAGHLADKVGRRRVLIASLALSLAAWSALIFMPHLPLPVFAVMCVITGGLMNIANPVGVALGQQLVPGHSSLVSGVLMGLAWALGGFAPLIMGVVAARYGVITALGLMTAAIAAALPLAMAVPRKAG
jgi:MFS family permease